MALKQTQYDHLSTEELARDPNQPLRSRDTEKKGILGPLNERLSRPVVLGLIGVAGVAGAFNLPQRMAQRFADVLNPNTVTKVHTETNAVNPYNGNATDTTRLVYEQQVIGK